MFGAIGTIHRKLSPKAIRPAMMTGRFSTNESRLRGFKRVALNYSVSQSPDNVKTP
jgi:hypothetical protein